MHSNRTFHWTDQAELLAFIADISFAHLFVPSPEGPLVAHVPMVVTADGNLRFHLARANPPAKYLDGAVALASFAGADAYISPDWYASADQVPTWNYVTVEVRGPVRRLSDTDLIGNLDSLSIVNERRLLPKKPWTRGKMRPGLFNGMLKAIVGFEMEVESLRGTRKLGQNKDSADVEGAAAGLEAAGHREMAALMRTPRA
jgi:transcriptional regulator